MLSPPPHAEKGTLSNSSALRNAFESVRKASRRRTRQTQRKRRTNLAREEPAGLVSLGGNLRFLMDNHFGDRHIRVLFFGFFYSLSQSLNTGNNNNNNRRRLLQSRLINGFHQNSRWNRCP